MHFYRFRPASEISFKELLYDEIYFCSADECNDPLDNKAFFHFTNDQNSWERLLRFALGNGLGFSPSININALAAELSKRCPITVEELLDDICPQGSAAIVAHGFPIPGIEQYISAVLSNAIKTYVPSSTSFVSFSRTNSETLLWSHYASNHSGFALIFKSVNGQLSLCPNRQRKSIKIYNVNGPQTSYGLPSSFNFEEVSYVQDVESFDAFKLFPAQVSQLTLTEEERIRMVSEQRAQYLRKNITWEYEQESRLVLHSPSAWLAGPREYSQNERLFHYEPTQLVGLIFGCRTTEAHKARLLEIIQDRNDRIARQSGHPRIFFDVVIHQAQLKPNSRDVHIEPLMITGLGSAIKSNHPNFQTKYKSWLDGNGLKFNAEGGAESVTIKY